MEPNKTLIVHDLFHIMGGGERLVHTLAAGLGADLLTGHIGPDSFDLSDLPGEVKNLRALSRIHGIKTWHLARAFRRHPAIELPYAAVIYSGVASPLAVHRYPQAKSIFYCHTPPRFVYDKQAHYMASMNPLKQWAFRRLIQWFQPQYEAAVANMDVVLTNSHYVQQRIKDSIQQEAQVVYPPCDTGRFTWQGQSDYYLSLARHDELKRVDQVIQAFNRMPHKKLVVASGGEQTKQLQHLAQGNPNIRFTGWLSDAQLRELMGQCIATIYIPTDEDFGMSPVESMSAGKPVICSDHGGLLESVHDQETGIYVADEDLVGQLIEAVGQLDAPRAARMRSACEARAQGFDTRIFLQKIKEFL
ncbi:glycosyltransferase [Marinicella meishanensis]|uniref:glycosyltransferase n=1 Tax=Marinicella meishanensis TaxID=2873263 RepID=UPI001CBE1E2C|nr:glycosyltransferase [Marinicella sp. NBU2979]